MNKIELIKQIKSKKSFLCVGLDTDITKIPEHLLDSEDPVFEFNKQIIDATQDLCVAYKPNSAFYESLGSKGWESLQKTESYISSDIFKIIDAKRGDIGNTSKLYAKAFFENMNFFIKNNLAKKKKNLANIIYLKFLIFAMSYKNLIFFEYIKQEYAL